MHAFLLNLYDKVAVKSDLVPCQRNKCMYFSECYHRRTKSNKPLGTLERDKFILSESLSLTGLRLVLTLPETFGKQSQNSIKYAKRGKSGRRKLQKHIGGSTHPCSSPSAFATPATSSSTASPKLLVFLHILWRPDAS